MLPGVEIEHELGERALEPRHSAPEDREARLGDPRCPLEVEPQRRADLLVGFRGKGERARLAPVANLDVVVLTLAFGDRRMGQVRQLEQEGLEALVDGLELGVERLDTLAHLAHAGLLGAGVLTPALGLADRLGGFVAQGLEVFALADEPTALGVEGDHLGDELGTTLVREPTPHRLGLLADLPDVKHGATGLRPARCSPTRPARPSRPDRRLRGR